MIIREVTKNDVERVLDLFAAADQRHIFNQYYYIWRNFKCTFGKALSYIIEDESNNQIIGHYSILPQVLKVGTTSIKGGLGQQALIHPEHRNLQNILDLVNHSTKKAKEYGLEFVYGFPNDNFYLVQERFLKWTKISRFCSKEILIDDIVKKLGKVSSSENFDIIRISKRNFSRYKDGLSKMKIHLKADKIILNSNINYIKWRYIDNPISFYSIFAITDKISLLGYIVLKLYYTGKELVGHIMQLETSNEKATLQLFKHSLDYFKRQGVNKLITWDMNEHLCDLLTKITLKDGFETNFYCKNLTLDLDTLNKLLDKSMWKMDMHYSDAF